MDLVGDDVLARIAICLSLEDLLRLARVSKRLHALVLSDSLGEAAWQRLYLSHFGGAPAATAPEQQQLPEEASTWRARFKARYVEAGAQERLRRAARRHKYESRLQALDLEVHRHRAALAAERRTLAALEAEAAALAQTRAAAESQRLAQLYWQPVAVARAQGVVTDQSEPMDVSSSDAQRGAAAAGGG